MRILSGGGLTFNGDTAAGNALDDYEEGTFTATLGMTSAAMTISGTSSWTGYYVKVGSLCHVHAYITVAVTDDGGGWMYIAGLPFTSHNGTYSTIGITHDTLTDQDAENGYVQPGNTIIYPVQENNTVATTPNDDGATRYLMFGGTYRV